MIFLYILLGLTSVILTLGLAYFIVPAVFALFVNPKKQYLHDSRIYRRLLNILTGVGLWFMRVKVDINGIEKLPVNEKLLFVGNHRSNFDPLVTWNVFKKWQISYISKAANLKIPIFGQIIRRCCFMVIDRKSPRNAINTINTAGELLKSREVSVGVYPEGTRSKDGTLLTFHSGVFRIAQKGEAAIAIIAVSGTENIHKNFPFKSTRVSLEVLDVISAEDATTKSSKELSEYSRQLMEDWCSK